MDGANAKRGHEILLSLIDCADRYRTGVGSTRVSSELIDSAQYAHRTTVAYTDGEPFPIEQLHRDPMEFFCKLQCESLFLDSHDGNVDQLFSADEYKDRCKKQMMLSLLCKPVKSKKGWAVAMVKEIHSKKMNRALDHVCILSQKDIGCLETAFCTANILINCKKEQLAKKWINDIILPAINARNELQRTNLLCAIFPAEIIENVCLHSEQLLGLYTGTLISAVEKQQIGSADNVLERLESLIRSQCCVGRNHSAVRNAISKSSSTLIKALLKE
jgi:hypothetical protein